MGRLRRVRELTTWELERELDRLEQDVVVEALLYDGSRPAEASLSAAERRWRRIARELARRDYVERAHGRRCACADCFQLLEQWIHLRRRELE
jgi:hypothetical protein